MNSPPRGRRRARRPLLRLAGLDAVFVLASGLGAGIALVSQGGLSLPRGTEPPRQAAGDPAQATEPLQAPTLRRRASRTRVVGKARKKPPPATTTSAFGTTQKSEGGRLSTRTSPPWRGGPSSTCTSFRAGRRRSSTRPLPRTPSRTAPT